MVCAVAAPRRSHEVCAIHQAGRAGMRTRRRMGPRAAPAAGGRGAETDFEDHSRRNRHQTCRSEEEMRIFTPLEKLLFASAIAGFALSTAAMGVLPPGYTIPIVDISGETNRQVVVDRESGQYLGHPSTVLLEDGRTLLTVYPKGHGRGALILKRSTDGGRTWSKRLPVPENWATSLETPTIHRVLDEQGRKRLVVWSGLYPARLSVSENDGNTWTPLKPVGDWGGIVVMGSVEALRDRPGHYLALFHDDGRFFTKTPNTTKPVAMTLYQTESFDGGLTWHRPRALFTSSEIHLCEPGLFRS